MTLNYYILEKIEKDPDYGLHYGYLNGKFTEVWGRCEDDTDAYLKENGFALCDAPNWDDTMLIDESGWEYLNDTNCK